MNFYRIYRISKIFKYISHNTIQYKIMIILGYSASVQMTPRHNEQDFQSIQFTFVEREKENLTTSGHVWDIKRIRPSVPCSLKTHQKCEIESTRRHV